MEALMPTPGMPRALERIAIADEDTSAAEFEYFVREHSRFVFRVANALLRNSHDAEDAVQETFLKLYRTRSWRKAKNPRAFLARIAWRLALERLPKRRWSTEDEIREDDLPSSLPNPEEEALSADWSALVHRLIDALPENLRQPLALSAVGEMNSREIARVLGIAEGTVRTRLMRARQMLKEKLAVLLEKRHESR